jgi:hypothetical protein
VLRDVLSRALPKRADVINGYEKTGKTDRSGFSRGVRLVWHRDSSQQLEAFAGYVLEVLRADDARTYAAFSARRQLTRGKRPLTTEVKGGWLKLSRPEQARVKFYEDRKH